MLESDPCNNAAHAANRQIAATTLPALNHHSGRDQPGKSAPLPAHYGIYRTPVPKDDPFG